MLFTDMDQYGPVVGTDYSDWFRGGPGPDRLEGGLNLPNAPYMYGFGDTVDYTESNQGVNVDLGDQDDVAGLAAEGIVPNISGGYAEGDQLEGIENAVGSRYNDNLVGDRGDNRLFGGRGSDFLWGDSGNDRLWGDYDGGSMQDGVTDEDILHGGHDELHGGAGRDALEGGAGADKLDGGAGIDTARYTRSNAGVTVSLADGSGKGAHAEGDELSNIENLRGSMYGDMLAGNSGSNHIDGSVGDDTLEGGSGADMLWGGRGNDMLWGQAGDDHLVGDVGDDTLEGGEGKDWLNGDGGGTDESHADSRDAASYTESNAGVIIDLSSADPMTGRVRPTSTGGHADGDDLFNIEDLVGSMHGDELTGDDSANRIWGGDGDDEIMGGDGADMLMGGKGADEIMGGDGDDEIMGGDGADMLMGGKGADEIMGGDGDDMIMGGDGADDLMGDAGADRIYGGAGDDMLEGGLGSDTFVFSGKFGNDTIGDFTNGSDKLDLRSFAGLDLAAVINNREVVPGGIELDLADGGVAGVVGTITLMGYDHDDDLEVDAIFIV